MSEHNPTSRRDFIAGLMAAGTLSSIPFANAKRAGDHRKTAVVIGAGIAGLSAAHELRRGGFNVAIFEKRDWSGGRMREAWMGPLYGYTHAQGVFMANNEMLSLAKEFGIEDELKGQNIIGPVENEYGTYPQTARWHIDDFANIPGLSEDTKRRLPALQADLDKIREEVDPCLLATGAQYDDESLGDYYERMLGKDAATEIIRYWIEPALAWWGWPTYLTSKIAMLSWFSQQKADFVDPRGGIGVLTRKLASVLPIQQRTTVRFISPPDAHGRHTIHYLTPDLQAASVTPDVVVVATEGKFVYPLVQDLSPSQQSFFKAIDVTKEAIIYYVLDPAAAPKQPMGGAYIPSHPDRMKRRVTNWAVLPPQPERHNRPATAVVDLSRPEVIRWQWSNEPMDKYCEPIMKHFWPEFDMRNVTDVVNYTCDDLIQIPVGYVRQMAAIAREQDKGKRGLYFAGEYLAGAHTGAACASGRSVARTIVRHWS